MNTYLVRTTLDQTLIGIFCADSMKALAAIIDQVFDARECECLQMKANEGLFVEGKFVTTAGEHGVEEVHLVHPDDALAAQGDADLELTEEPSEEALAAAELLLLAGEEEPIPTVLEPSAALRHHLQCAHRGNEWQPLVKQVATTRAYKAMSAPADASINADRIARKLMEGALNPAMFMHNGSNRHH